MQGVAGVPKPVLGLVCQHMANRPWGGGQAREIAGVQSTYIVGSNAPFFVHPLTKVGDLLVAVATYFSPGWNGFNASWSPVIISESGSGGYPIYDESQVALYYWKRATAEDLVSVPSTMINSCVVSVVTIRNCEGVSTARAVYQIQPSAGGNGFIPTRSAGVGKSIAFLVDREPIPYAANCYPNIREPYKLWELTSFPGDAYPKAVFEVQATTPNGTVVNWQVPDITTRSFGLSWVQILLK